MHWVTGKRLLAFLWTGMLLATAARAQDGQFLGFYDYKPPGDKCSSRAFETKPVASLAEFKELETAFKAAHPDPINTICWLLKPDECAIVYEYRTMRVGWDCTVTTVTHLKASSVEQARERLDERVARDPKHFVTPPRIVFTWVGSGGRKTVYEQDYEGVRIKFTVGKTASGTVVLAQGRNTNASQTVLLEFQAGGKTHRLVVLPGDSFNLPLGKVDEFEIAAQKIATPPADEKSLSDRAIDLLKDRMRQKITVPDGALRPGERYTTVGVRG